MSENEIDERFKPFPDGHKELVRETEWSREFRVAPRGYELESKMMTDGLEVAAASLKRRWAQMSEVEKVDFANSYRPKYPLDANDQEILYFLMDAGPEIVWSSVTLQFYGHAPLLHPRYTIREASAIGGNTLPAKKSWLTPALSRIIFQTKVMRTGADPC